MGRKRSKEYWRRKKQGQRERRRLRERGNPLSWPAAIKKAEAETFQKFGMTAFYSKFGFTGIEEKEMEDQTYGGLLRKLLMKASSGKEIKLIGFVDENHAIALRHKLYRMREAEKALKDKLGMAEIPHPWENLTLLIRRGPRGTFEILMVQDMFYYGSLEIAEIETGKVIGTVKDLLLEPTYPLLETPPTNGAAQSTEPEREKSWDGIVPKGKDPFGTD